VIADRTAYDVPYILANYQSWRTAGTHEFMNAPKLNHSSVTDQSSRSRFLPLVFAVRFAAKRYILQQECRKGQIGTCPGC